MRISITGSIAYDYIMSYPRDFKEMLLAESLDHISVSFLVDDMTRHRGGVAPNIAYTMALLGGHPVVVATAGQDFEEYRARLESAGVDTGGTRTIPELFTASFFVATDHNQSQIAMFYAGAMTRARELSLADAVPDGPDLVVISPNDPQAMLNYIRECKARAIPYVYDPGQQVARSEARDLAEGVDGAYILILNAYEFSALGKKTGLSHDEIMEQANVVIVTRGENGADIYLDDQTFHIPVVPPARIADPTGVGDAFRGGLLRGVAAGWGWELSGRMGALAATYVLEQVGTQNHRFTPDEFVARFRQHFDDEGLLDSLSVPPPQD